MARKDKENDRIPVREHTRGRKPPPPPPRQKIAPGMIPGMANGPAPAPQPEPDQDNDVLEDGV